jgi:hypothetical protein
MITLGVIFLFQNSQTTTKVHAIINPSLLVPDIEMRSFEIEKNKERLPNETQLQGGDSVTLVADMKNISKYSYGENFAIKWEMAKCEIRSQFSIVCDNLETIGHGGTKPLAGGERALPRAGQTGEDLPEGVETSNIRFDWNNIEPGIYHIQVSAITNSKEWIYQENNKENNTYSRYIYMSAKRDLTNQLMINPTSLRMVPPELILN